MEIVFSNAFNQLILQGNFLFCRCLVFFALYCNVQILYAIEVHGEFDTITKFVEEKIIKTLVLESSHNHRKHIQIPVLHINARL